MGLRPDIIACEGGRRLDPQRGVAFDDGQIIAQNDESGSDGSTNQKGQRRFRFLAEFAHATAPADHQPTDIGEHGGDKGEDNFQGLSVFLLLAPPQAFKQEACGDRQRKEKKGEINPRRPQPVNLERQIKMHGYAFGQKGNADDARDRVRQSDQQQSDGIRKLRFHRFTSLCLKLCEKQPLSTFYLRYV